MGHLNPNNNQQNILFMETDTHAWHQYVNHVSIQPTWPWEPLLANLALVHFVFATGPSQSCQMWTLMQKGAVVLQYHGKWRDWPGMQWKSIVTGYQCWIHSLEQVHSDLSHLKGTNQKMVITCSLVDCTLTAAAGCYSPPFVHFYHWLISMVHQTQWMNSNWEDFQGLLLVLAHAIGSAVLTCQVIGTYQHRVLLVMLVRKRMHYTWVRGEVWMKASSSRDPSPVRQVK